MHRTRTRITTFLTFPGNAWEAIDFYTAVFPGSRIVEVTRFEEGGPGEPGKVLNGVVELLGTEMMFMDLDKSQVPAFAWSTSLLVYCDEDDEFDLLFEKLSAGGIVMMGPEPVLDMRKVAWVTDKFGVTWQLVFE